ncbi:Cof-type HAD-IIB family hydrolase [Aerococcus urinae]|uniref:Cof-type HAD-IIB family hydrolase n=1 Tax=Aerococcus urinae TaxID=1376 RepID=UPI00254FCBBA|nr:Cof-type HAD-IIB family hydrolase [Aerococcus urinae]MDK6371100.1 Cof-type HAD-IIB family hydrolase [Aerococcus urinae]
MIKILAIDLDGTLLDSNEDISKENINAVHYAIKKGVNVILCTGRPYSMAKYCAKKLNIQNDKTIIITNNGSMIQYLKDASIVLRNGLDKTDVMYWKEKCAKVDIPITLVDSNYCYEPLEYVSQYESQYSKRSSTRELKMIEFENISSNEIFDKIVICTEQELLDLKTTQLVNNNDTKNYYIVRSEPVLLEILNNKANKWNALKYIANQAGVHDYEIMSIGDQMNDYEMIKHSNVGIAMGNAVNDLKIIADYVTDTNINDGVAKAIYKFI